LVSILFGSLAGSRCHVARHFRTLLPVPANWRILMLVICVFLIASVAIGTIQLLSTPTEIFGAGFEGLPKQEFPR
jgi:hypothetical protein